MYQHYHWHGEALDYPVNKVVCVGRNYADHVKELNNKIPVEPVLFIKPETALCYMNQPLSIPQNSGAVHHEVELAVLLGTTLTQASVDDACAAIIGYGVALDLTLRDVQTACKKEGLPWEKAKGFDNSCPVSGFISVSELAADVKNIELKLQVNGHLRQHGFTKNMITPVPELIACMSNHFTLRAGDIVLTGTPAGVGPLISGDNLKVSLAGFEISTRVL